MVLLETPNIDRSFEMQSFSLLGIDEKYHKSQDLEGEKGTVIAFICNHCPYVNSILDVIVETSRTLMDNGISFVALMPNDYTTYEEDSFDNMKKNSNDNNFPFPYLLDEGGKVAKLYGAVCTPDIFGFNKNKELVYRGRICDKNDKKNKDKRDLLNFMLAIANDETPSIEQIPSIGCSIKWRNE